MYVVESHDLDEDIAKNIETEYGQKKGLWTLKYCNVQKVVLLYGVIGSRFKRKATQNHMVGQNLSLAGITIGWTRRNMSYVVCSKIMKGKNKCVSLSTLYCIS